MTDAAGLLHALRTYEIERVKEQLAPARRVLELGGADGFQASAIASWGCFVASVDVADRERHQLAHPVIDYDGVRLPIRDRSVDRVFSSNVLEHVRDLPGLLAETRRVLAPGGLAVHVLPSTSWRWWTIVAHYGYLTKRLLRIPHEIPGATAVPRDAASVFRRRGLRGTLAALLGLRPHGEYANALTELYTFSTRRWVGVFRRHGFDVVSVESSGLFYSGYMLHPRWSVDDRRRRAGRYGSATTIFVLRPRGG